MPLKAPPSYTKGKIDRLIEAAAQLRPRGALRPHTYATVLALPVSTGLRISEALGLRFADITADGLLIREIKFRKYLACLAIGNLCESGLIYREGNKPLSA